MEVDKRGRQMVDAKTGFQKAAERGDAYVWTIESYAFSASDTLLAIRNNGTKVLHIEKVFVQTSHASAEIEIHRVTAAYTNAGTAVTGTNLLPGGAAADVDATADETGNTQGTVIERRIAREYALVEVDFKGAVTLNTGQAIGVDTTLGDDVCYVSIWGYFEDASELE